MERPICFTPGPAYTVSVDAVGNVRWSGIAHVKTLGRASWKINREAIKGLRERLREIKFRSLQIMNPDVYDVDECIFTLAHADGSKKRLSYSPGDDPEALRRLERDIDKLLGTYKHVGPKPATRRSR